MHPEDRVLVGVINRKKDFEIARDQHWYRVPEGKAPKGLYAEYVAFFLSSAFGKQNGAIHYYAERTGFELATRAQLLPDEPNHPRANAVYHRLQFGELQAKVPPIRNSTKRRFSFIYTTWDRFIHARSLDDLYSRADHLVDRLFYALRDAGLRPQRRWELENGYPMQSAQVRILCEQGEVIASTHANEGLFISENMDENVAEINHQIMTLGGAVMLSLPIE